MIPNSSTGPAATAAVPTRQQSLGVLAKSLSAEFRTALAHLGDLPAFDLLRPAETGTVMVQGRVGGIGAAFKADTASALWPVEDAFYGVKCG